MHRASVQVVTVEFAVKDDDAHVGHRAQVDEVPKRIAQEALVYEGEEQPLDERDRHVQEDRDGKPKEVTLLADVFRRLVDGEASAGIGRREVLESGDLEEEEDEADLDLRADLAQRLQLVPLVADEQRSPDAHRRLGVDALGVATWQRAWLLPVEEEDVDVDLEGDDVEEVDQLEDEGDYE